LLFDDLAADLNDDSDNDDYASDPDYPDHPSENDDGNSQITGVMDDDEFFDTQQGDHDDGDEDGNDELDDDNGEIAGVEANKGNEKHYDFRSNNDPYDDSNNIYDENSNDETDLESNDGTSPGVKQTTTRSGRTISKPSILNVSNWKGKTYGDVYGKSEPDMEESNTPTTVPTQNTEKIPRKIPSPNLTLIKTQFLSTWTTVSRIKSCGQISIPGKNPKIEEGSLQRVVEFIAAEMSHSTADKFVNAMYPIWNEPRTKTISR